MPSVFALGLCECYGRTVLGMRAVAEVSEMKSGEKKQNIYIIPIKTCRWHISAAEIRRLGWPCFSHLITPLTAA